MSLALLAWPSIARADQPALAFGATSARIANNPTLDALRGIARSFWAERHVIVPTGESYLVDQCDCGAYDSGPDIYVPIRAVADVQSHPTWNLLAGALCAAVVHETGHAAGLGHVNTGVMSADVEVMHGDAPAVEVVPWTCRVWANGRRAHARRLRR